MTPEEPPPLKKLKTEEVFKEKEKHELTLEVLDNEPGFYQSTMRSMLLPGHEGELCTYLKEMGLIQRSVRCQGCEKMPNCSSPMKWTQARIIDKYTWKCDECGNKCSIREDSFFKLTKCSLMSTIRILLGWCKDIDPEEISSVLNVKVHPIKKLYEICSQVIDNYVRSKPHEWKIGGDNVIVIVDVYPEGCTKLNGNRPEFQNNNTTQILCLAEVKAIPTQYWFHILNSQDREAANLEVLEIIRNMVRSNSILVSDPSSKIVLYNDLMNMKEYFHITVDQLMKHNRPGCTIFQILDRIWEPALVICNEAQSYQHQLVQSFLYNQLWRRKFARTPSSALEYFLHHIADNYPLTRL